MANLITLEEFKAALGGEAKSSTSRDPELDVALAAATDWVRSEAQRQITSGAITERRNGSGTDRMRLREWPVEVTPLPVISENGLALTISVDYDAAKDVLLDPVDGWIYRQPGQTGALGQKLLVPGRWSVGFNNVKAVYTAGYPTSTVAVPEDLKMLAKYVAARFWKDFERKEIGIRRRSQGGASTEFEGDLPALYRAILNRYTRKFYSE